MAFPLRVYTSSRTIVHNTWYCQLAYMSNGTTVSILLSQVLISLRINNDMGRLFIDFLLVLFYEGPTVLRFCTIAARNGIFSFERISWSSWKMGACSTFHCSDILNIILSMVTARNVALIVLWCLYFQM